MFVCTLIKFYNITSVFHYLDLLKPFYFHHVAEKLRLKRQTIYYLNLPEKQLLYILYCVMVL